MSSGFPVKGEGNEISQSEIAINFKLDKDSLMDLSPAIVANNEVGSDEKDQHLGQERILDKAIHRGTGSHDSTQDSDEEQLKQPTLSSSIQEEQEAEEANKEPVDSSEAEALHKALSLLVEYSSSDSKCLGILPMNIEKLFEARYEQSLPSSWWKSFISLPGVYYYNLHKGSSLFRPVLSAKPFLPRDIESFRANCLELCRTKNAYPLKILLPSMFERLYYVKYGRPWFIDYQRDESWFDALMGMPGIIVHKTSSGSRVAVFLCCMGKLKYPVCADLEIVPVYAQTVTFQLNELIVMLSKSTCALDMKALGSMFKEQFKKPLKRLITCSDLLSRVEGVVTQDGLYSYSLPITCVHPAIEKRKTKMRDLYKAQIITPTVLRSSLSEADKTKPAVVLPTLEEGKSYAVGILKGLTGPITLTEFASRFIKVTRCRITKVFGKSNAWIRQVASIPGVRLHAGEQIVSYHQDTTASLESNGIAPRNGKKKKKKAKTKASATAPHRNSQPSQLAIIGHEEMEVENDEKALKLTEREQSRSEPKDSMLRPTRSKEPAHKGRINANVNGPVDPVSLEKPEDKIVVSSETTNPSSPRNRQASKFSPRSQQAVATSLSNFEVCKIAVVLKKLACKVTASHFAEVYFSSYHKPVRAILEDGTALTEQDARSVDVLLWYFDVKFGPERIQSLLDSVSTESLTALSPYATSIVLVLDKFSQSDSQNVGMSSSQLANDFEEQDGVILRLVSPLWWQAIIKLSGVFFYLVDDEAEFTDSNIRFSRKPFIPLPEDAFLSRFKELLSLGEPSPFNVFTPKKLACLYLLKYGRPVHVDCQQRNWTDVLGGLNGIILYNLVNNGGGGDGIHDRVICALGKLTYPVHSNSIDAPRFAQLMCLQLNSLIEILYKSECSMSMQALDAAHRQSSPSLNLLPIIKASQLLAYVEGVSVDSHPSSSLLLYSYRGKEPVTSANNNMGDFYGTVEIPNCRYNSPSAVPTTAGISINDDQQMSSAYIDEDKDSDSSLKLSKSKYTAEELVALRHLETLTKAGEYISAAQLNDTMRSVTGKSLKDVLGSSEDQKWWIRVTAIPGIQFRFVGGDRTKSLNTLVTYSSEVGEMLAGEGFNPKYLSSLSVIPILPDKNVENNRDFISRPLRKSYSAEISRSHETDNVFLSQDNGESPSMLYPPSDLTHRSLSPDSSSPRPPSMVKGHKLAPTKFISKVNAAYRPTLQASSESPRSLSPDTSSPQCYQRPNVFQQAVLSIAAQANERKSALHCSGPKYGKTTFEESDLPGEVHPVKTSSDLSDTASAHIDAPAISPKLSHKRKGPSSSGSVDSFKVPEPKRNSPLVVSSSVAQPLQESLPHQAVLEHLASLTKAGEYISAAQLNDTMRSVTGKSLKDVLGSSEDQKWWIRVTAIPGIQFRFVGGDRTKSLNTLLTYTTEVYQSNSSVSSTVGSVSTTDSNPGKKDTVTLDFGDVGMVDEDGSDFLSRPKVSTATAGWPPGPKASPRDQSSAKIAPTIVAKAVDEALSSSVGGEGIKRSRDNDSDSGATNKKPRTDLSVAADSSSSSSPSGTPLSTSAAMAVDNAPQPPARIVINNVKLLKPSDGSARRMELVHTINKNLDLMVNTPDESFAEILEALGDYFCKKRQFELANPKAVVADDASVALLVQSIAKHLKTVTSSLTDRAATKLFASIRKLPQPACIRILEGLKARLMGSVSGPVLDPETICNCFYQVKVFPFCPELKETLLLLGEKLQQWHVKNPEEKLSSLQYARVILAFKEIAVVDETMSALLRSINGLMGLPADLEDALADYRQWGSGAHIACASASLVELKYIGKGLIKMMNSVMQSSNDFINQNFAFWHKPHDAAMSDPLITICAYMAVKLSALMKKESENKTLLADEDLVVYILQILRGQNSEDIRLRLLLDNLVQYARLLPIGSLKEKFCEPVVIFIAFMENYSSDHRVVENLLSFFETILAHYRSLPASESCAAFDEAYLARSTKYLFSPPYMRNAMRNMSSSSRIVMRFIMQLQPWLNDYPFRGGVVRGEMKWDPDIIGLAYLGFRRMRERAKLAEPPSNDTSAMASYNQITAYIENFQQYTQSTMTIPFGHRVVSARFLKCIAMCLMNLPESDEVFAFIVKELVDMLRVSEEELAAANLLPLDVVADLMYVLGGKRGWKDAAGIQILSSLFNLTKNLSSQGVKESANVTESDLTHYITMLSSLQGVIIVNQVLLKWFDKLLHFIFNTQVWDAHGALLSFDQLFQRVSNVCGDVSVLLQSRHRLVAPCLQQLDVLFVKLAAKCGERTVDDSFQISPLLLLAQMSSWQVYLQRLSSDAITPCQGFSQFIDLTCAALIAAPIRSSSPSDWDSLMSAVHVLVDAIILMIRKHGLPESLAGSLLHMMQTVFNFTGRDEQAINLADDLLEEILSQPKQQEDPSIEDSVARDEAILNSLLEYAQKVHIQSVTVDEEPDRLDKPKKDVYSLASYTLKCLADKCYHDSIREDITLLTQLQQVVILCLTLALAYIDELGTLQLQQVMYFCRRYTKEQLFFCTTLQHTVRHVLEECFGKAVRLLETALWTFQNGQKADNPGDDGFQWSDRRVRQDEQGRMRDFLRLVSEDSLALFVECMLIRDTFIENRCQREKQRLSIVYNHFFHGVMALPYRAYAIQFDFLEMSFAAPAIPCTRKLEAPLLWRDVQDYAVRYLLGKLGSVDAVHHAVVHGVPCLLAWPIRSVTARQRAQSLPANWQGAHRADCVNGEIYATCRGGDGAGGEEEVLWLCLDVLPLTRCVPVSLPRVCGWDDGRLLGDQLGVQYAALLVDAVCESKPKALLQSVCRLIDKFLDVMGLVNACA